MDEATSNRRIVLVSGPPGSGKTTVARPLAEALGFALISKDDIKEPLYTALQGPPGDLAFSQKTGAAAMEILWALAPHCPGVVLEANFRTKSAHERDKVAALPGRVIEVHCRISLEEASRRFTERARRERHHPAHPLQEISIEELEQFSDPFGLTPVIEVDTSAPVETAPILEKLESLWRAGHPGGSSTETPSAI